jgi:hypothetical protein
VVSSGIFGTTCFLPFTAVPNSFGTLQVGQPIECVVEAVNTVAGAVTLRAQRKAVAETVARGSKLAFNSLQPGMLVNALVDVIGAVCRFLSALLMTRRMV